MCEQLADICRAVLEYSRRFDPGALSAEAAGAVVGLCASIQASVSSLQSLAASRHAESGSWKADGYRSAAEQLAHATGTSTGAARQLLDTGQRLGRLPEVARAALAGELSPRQAALVADAASLNPAKTGQLLEHARSGSLSELQEEVSKAKAEVSDLEQRRRVIHQRRRFSSWTDTDGAWNARLYGDPQDGARLLRVIGDIRRRLILTRREADIHDELAAVDFDALATLARIAQGIESEVSLADLLADGLFPQINAIATAPPGGSPGGSPGSDPPGRKPRRRVGGRQVKIMVRVDLDTLLRGVPIDGEVCEIAGYGPVPVSTVRDMIALDDPFIAAVVTKGHRLTGVAHYGRAPTATQQTALDFLYPTCAATGCSSRASLQADHRIDWAKTHYTLIDLMDMLCPHHHHLKTTRNWALTPGTGKRPFVPPTDTRHPQHNRQRTKTQAPGI